MAVRDSSGRLTNVKSGKAAAEQRPLNYEMSPTGEAFHSSSAPIRAVMGPVGGGKTSMCCMEILFASMRQAAHPITKIRSVRWAITRATYNEIENMLLPTFMEWIGRFNPDGLRKSTPMSWKAEIPLDDGTELHMEVLFYSVSTRDEAAEKFRGLELTGLFVSEYSTLSVENFEVMATRVGRWPKRELDTNGKLLVECTSPTVILESNPPSRESDWYQFFHGAGAARTGKALFRQPPAVLEAGYDSDNNIIYMPNPDADNFKHHSGGGQRYYANLISSMGSREKIQTLLQGEYGRSKDGNPVWPMFRESVHVATQQVLGKIEKIPVDPGRPVWAGMDFGLNSAIVFGQVDSGGRLVITDAEWRPEFGTRPFAESVILPLLRERYNGLALHIYGDPTGVNRGSSDGYTSFDLLRDVGLQASPAPSNSIQHRIASAGEYFNRPDGVIISPHCRDLIEALAGGYAFVRHRTGEVKPNKGDYSHIADAFSYLTLSLNSKSNSATLRAELETQAKRRSEKTPGMMSSRRSVSRAAGSV